MDKRLNFILGIWVIVLVSSLVYLNPKILIAERGDSRRQFQETPLLAAPFVIKEADIKETQAQPDAIYRGDVQRHGIYYADLPYLMLRRIWRIDPFNDHPHSASKSTPVTDGKHIFVGDDLGTMSAIDLDGQVKWEYTSNSPQGIHGSALVVDDVVFWGDYAGVLYAADKIQGQLLWQIHLGETIGASPLYKDQALYISVETFYRPNGFVAKINARNGQILWLSPYLGAQAHSSPTMSSDGRLIFVGDNNGYLTALDVDTGEFRWRFQVGGAIKGTPAVLDDSVYFCSWDSYLYKLSSKGEEVWRAPLGSECQSSAVFSVLSGKVFVSTRAGQVQAFNLQNGEIEWSHKGTGALLSSGVIVQDKNKKESLVMVCSDTKVCLFDPASGKVQASIRTESNVTSVPMIFERTVFLAMSKRGGLGRWK